MKKESKFKDKKVITIIILVLVIVGLVTYIAFDKNIIFKSIASVNEMKGGAVKKLDLTKSLNTEGVKYSNPTTKEGDYGLNVTVNDNRKTATLSIDWPRFNGNNFILYYGR